MTAKTRTSTIKTNMKSCTKTVCTKKPSKKVEYALSTDLFDGYSIRCVSVGNRKMYFVSDLVEIYGRGFIDKLANKPSTMRIKVGDNSQTRRLVSYKDFMKALKATPSYKANIL